GRLGESGDRGAQLLQPQAEPGALEAGVAGPEDAAVAPEAQAQTFQGGDAPVQSSSSKRRSRMVSMGCQKPSWRKAASWPPAASFSRGSCSHTVSSPAMRSMTGFESNKKPPLMKPSLAGSFSRKAAMRSPFSCTEPKRAGGRTMVMV